MKRVIAFANILVVFISVSSAAQESARTVQYHSQDIADPCEVEVHYVN